VLWLDLIGAWLLVAGPMYQAVIELRSLVINRERFEQLGRPKQVSRWLWILPPLRMMLQRREHYRYFEKLHANVPLEDIDQLIRFIQKAEGWWLVTLGGFLIASSLSLKMFGWIGFAVSPVIAFVLGAFVIARAQAGDKLRSPPSRADAKTAAPDAT
jgi:hypothetical protein